uniref:Selenoprotein H n=1 Tax=Rhizophora mucronata TaxID=61149 RepID=A0A2P2IPU9_RHIMU
MTCLIQHISDTAQRTRNAKSTKIATMFLLLSHINLGNSLRDQKNNTEIYRIAFLGSTFNFVLVF